LSRFFFHEKFLSSVFLQIFDGAMGPSGPSRRRRHGVALVVAVQVMAGWDHRDQLDSRGYGGSKLLSMNIYIYIIYIYILYIYVYLKYVYIYKYTYLYDSICLISWDRGQHNQIHQHSAFNLRSWVNTAGASCFLGKSAAVPSRTGAALQGRNFKTRHQFPQLQGRYVKDWVYMGEIRLSRVLIGVLRNHLMGMALWFNASL
jgi:hypothetical protein